MVVQGAEAGEPYSRDELAAQVVLKILLVVAQVQEVPVVVVVVVEVEQPRWDGMTGALQQGEEVGQQKLDVMEVKGYEE